MEEYTTKPMDGPDDPNRCQAVLKSHQCTLKAVPGSSFCPSHGGNTGALKQKAEEVRNYRLTKFHAQLQRHGTSNHIKDLRDEIGILRMLVEERLNQCQDTTDLMLHSSVVSDLVMKVEKLVTSCNRAELQLNEVLDKTQAIQFAKEIIEVVASKIEDEDVLADISDEIIKRLAR